MPKLHLCLEVAVFWPHTMQVKSSHGILYTTGFHPELLMFFYLISFLYNCYTACSVSHIHYEYLCYFFVIISELESHGNRVGFLPRRNIYEFDFI